MTLSQFLNVKTPSGLAHLLGFASYAALAKVIYPTPRYSEFLLKKKNGTERVIQAPAHRLKEAQRRLLKYLELMPDPRPSAHGFQKGRSVVTGASEHCHPRKSYLLNIDLENFFPSITFARVYGLFRSAPFSFTESVAAVLAQLTCFRGLLPQGAPSSPIIANFICRRMDGSLQRLSKEARATYTRYGDDMSFSFSVKNRKDLPETMISPAGAPSIVGHGLLEIITANGFNLNQTKTRLMSKRGRMEVTGVLVNKKTNVRRNFIDEIRGMLHAWSKYGTTKAQEAFLQRPYKRQLRSGAIPRFERVLRGKLLYLKMIKGDSDHVYVRLARRFNSCIDKHPGSSATPLKVRPIVINETDLNKAIGVIMCEDKSVQQWNNGTGFILLDVGIVTCAHVVSFENDPNSLFSEPNGRIVFADNTETMICELEILAIDKIADIAILKPKTPLPNELLHLTSSKTTVTQSENVRLVGYPDHTPGKTLAIANGHVITVYSKKTKQLFDINEQIRKGNSGGPILNNKLEVVGIAVTGQKDMLSSNAAVAISELPKIS